MKIRDLEKSRRYWKERALGAEANAGASGEDRPEGDAAPSAERLERQALLPPARHTDPAVMIQWTLQLYLHAGLGIRGVARVLELFAPWHAMAAPRPSTVLNWVYRGGLALLQRPPERREDWIYVIDHTVSLGEAKCLVILGIPVSALAEHGDSPTHAAMTVLAVEVMTRSNGAAVAAALAQTSARTGPPVQIVADHGSDLSAGIARFQQAHAPQCIETYDISHRIATLLKAELSADARWSAFLEHCSATLSVFQQTDLAFLLPPRQRTKARYMHFAAHVEWAERLLAYHDRGDFSAIARPCVLSYPAWKHLRARFGAARVAPLRPLIGRRYAEKAAFCEALQAHSDLPLETLGDAFWSQADGGRERFLEGFAWLLEYREALHVYAEMMRQSQRIQSVLKTQGLGAQALTTLQAEQPARARLTPRARAFTDRLLACVEQEVAKVPPGQAWLASSDIIESVFGRYKHFTERGPLKEIGKLVLTIPALLTEWTPALIRDALERVRTVDVDHWIKAHLGDSLLAKRRRALIPYRYPHLAPRSYTPALRSTSGGRHGG
ncbi:hypothetical protein, partial [Thiorhodococcus minor]|uniref:hypothetical protein n=1 Tax=Thiorhodococcus minor TaxID=57489 RepID=UPI001ADAA742